MDQVEQQLFEWDVPEKRQRAPKPPPEVVDSDPSWKPLGRRSLVIGWHLPQSTNDKGAVIAMCGEVGRAITSDHTKMVKCQDCVVAVENHKRERDSRLDL